MSVPHSPDKPPALARHLGVIGQMHWFQRGTPEQRRMVAEAIAKARANARRCRELLARHPDLAAKAAAALGISSIDRWNGYVPPRFYEVGNSPSKPQWAPNDSPIRRVLLELLDEAYRREVG